MDKDRGISSGFSSEPASNSGVLSEKRVGNGLEQNEELGSKRVKARDFDSGTKTSNLQSDKYIGIVQQPHLSIEQMSGTKASTVLEKNICLPKTNSVSKDDDSRVAKSGKQALLENLTVKEDNNCKPQARESGLLGRDPSLSTPNSEKVGSFQKCNAASESDSMRRWMEMKRNNFLSGPLGGVATPSTAVASTPVEVPVQKQQKNKRRGDSSKKKNEVPKKEQQQVDRFANVTGPSGLLTEFNPGIITHIRSKEQVYSIIEKLIRNTTSTGERHVSLNAGDAVREDMSLAFNLPSTWVYDSPNFITNPEQATSLAVEAATVASQWLGFLHQDLIGRLTAVQDSKNRVQSILNTELPLIVSSRESSSNQESSLQMMDTNAPGHDSDKTVPEMHQTKWFAKFDQINKDLDDEERDLERSLNQVKEMQTRCNEGLIQMDEYSSFGKDWNQESCMEVQAAAASIFSTCSYLLSMMKPPPPPTSS